MRDEIDPLPELVRGAAEAVGGRIEGLEPVLGLVLGSGLGALADRFESLCTIPYDGIPGWPPVGVAGHAGILVAGRLAGVPALGLKGRAHLYEGYDPRVATLPVRVLARLGVRALFVSNAAGAIRPEFEPGDLMLITDHLNLMGRNPLVGPQVEGDVRFPDMSTAYDPELGAAVREAAASEGVVLREGTYAALLGPSYETPAEVRMLARLGADAVGMSTVPEVITARAIGLRCFGVSCLTNYAAGITSRPLSHDEVMETTERVADRFQRIVFGAVERLAPVLTASPSD